MKSYVVSPLEYYLLSENRDDAKGDALCPDAEAMPKADCAPDAAFVVDVADVSIACEPNMFRDLSSPSPLTGVLNRLLTLVEKGEDEAEEADPDEATDGKRVEFVEKSGVFCTDCRSLEAGSTEGIGSGT